MTTPADPDDRTTPAEDGPPAGRRRWLPRRRRPAPEAITPPPPAPEPPGGDEATAPQPSVPEADDPAIAPTGRAPSARRLRRERRRLLARREETVYHLGGLAFELYRRDLLGEDVARRRAVEVAEIDDTVRDIDVRLADIEQRRRERRSREVADPAVGCCLACRSTFRAEARFCWSCGTRLVPLSAEGDEQATAVIDLPRGT